MDWPPVTVLIVTYDRPREIRLVIDALRRHLNYPGKLRWHLADDSSPDGYVTQLKRDYPKLGFSVTVTDRKGWGANVNKAMVYAWDKHSDFVFLCEDDYVAKRPIDLRSGVAVLAADKAIGLIRYGGIAGHLLDLQLREVKTDIGKVQCLHIMKSSPHLNIYSNRPQLKHRRFHDCVGMYDEDKRLADTEVAFAHQVRDKYDGCPKVTALWDGIAMAFDHIGKSRQGSELDQVKQT